MKPVRLTYDFPIEVLWTDKRTVLCHSHDLDEESITIISPYRADVGEVFKLYFKILIKGKPVTIITPAEAKLCYLASEDDQFHIKLFFKQMHPEYQGLIKNFIREHS